MTSRSVRHLVRRLAAALLAAAPAVPAAAAPAAPKLVIAVSVDQLSADLFAEYRQRFTGGMKRLEGGVVFPSGFQSHGATETCPGHSTLLTGARPARTGIIANNWFDLGFSRTGTVYCAEDEKDPRRTADRHVVSPAHLRVPTLGDRLKAANPANRVVSVAGKDRAAVMMGGHATDQIWYFEGKAYATLLDRQGAPVPPVVARVNARIAGEIARGGTTPLPAACADRALALSVGARTLGTLAPVAPGSSDGWKTTPGFDAATADLAIGLIDEMKLGRGAGIDLLTVGLSATDYVGHGFGTEGAEMCTQMAALDAAMARILAAADRSGVPYLVVLSADHGGNDAVERQAARAMPGAGRVDPALLPGNLNRALKARLGIAQDILYGDGAMGDIYLNPDLSPTERVRATAALKGLWLSHPQVQAVFDSAELDRARPSGLPIDLWPLGERLAANHDGARSGDFYVVLKPQVIQIVAPPKGAVSGHGSVWNYDRRVPILFWAPGLAGFEQPMPVETVDIMPTLAARIGLPVPAAEIDGRCLDLDRGAEDACPR